MISSLVSGKEFNRASHGAAVCTLHSRPVALTTALLCVLLLPGRTLGQCASVPACGCRAAGKSSLVLKDKIPDDRDALTFKWQKGAETSTAELADPTQGTGYALCLYDATGLLCSLEVAGAAASWSALSGERGFRYRDTTGAQDGITKMLLRSGTAGRAKLAVMGKGLNLPDPTLELSEPVTAQLINQDSALCWTATYSGPGTIRRNDTERFRAIALAPALAPECTPTDPTPTNTPTDTTEPTPTTIPTPTSDVLYPVVDTNQSVCYNTSTETSCPSAGQSLFGQDAQYAGNQPSYTLSADGLTVFDNNTGLTWQRSPDTDGDGSLTYADKLLYSQALTRPATLNAANYGGYSDWRLPTLKELYSLILFSGAEASESSSVGAIPFINTNYFGFAYGFTSSGERVLDSQWVTTTLYVANANQLVGVNFADGRIKGYPATDAIGKKYFVICVRGNTNYGINNFVNNGDGTITDRATALMWAQADSGTGMNWSDALAWVQTQNAANYLGHNDWRLPNPKELHSVVDYTRSPDTTGSAAINSMFTVTTITNEAGQLDYPYYWTGTTLGNPRGTGERGVYISLGRTLGYSSQSGTWTDVHGAGAQRAEFKQGDPADYPHGFGPQGDAIRIFNYVRCVRDVGA